MSIAEDYNLVFGISDLSGFGKRPFISIINGNDAKNYEIASFLEYNGENIVDSIIFDINSFNYDNPIDDVAIWGYKDDESFYVRHRPPSPPVAVFNIGGTELEVPISDFLQILQEWKDFVASIPPPHWLDRR